MARDIRFTLAARAEVIDARDWYEARRIGLGQRFAAEVDWIVARMAENPEQFPIIRSDVRRAIFPRFPYGLYFRVLPEFVQVIACFHGRRDPTRWTWV